jgi:hypothetical protein
MVPYVHTSLDALDVLEIGDDRMVAVRRALGVGSFGINAFLGPTEGHVVIGEHDEVGSSAARHEELYLVLRGRATFTADGTTLDGPVGTILFVGDPTVRRGAIAAEPETLILVIGGAPGEAYRPGVWEFSYVAYGLDARGDQAGADAVLAEGAALHPASARLLYDTACLAARRGDGQVALGHLAAAHVLDPVAVTAWAARDPDLDAIRADPRFPAAG